MVDLGSFDANTVKPMEDREPIPPGEYMAQISDSALVKTKAQDGHYVKFVWEILEGDHQKRKVFVNLNLDNPNNQAVQIANRELSSICRAVGVMKVTDSVQLHGKPCKIKVGIRTQDGFSPQNTIKAYMNLSESSEPEPAAVTAGSAPPWRK